MAKKVAKKVLIKKPVRGEINSDLDSSSVKNKTVTSITKANSTDDVILQEDAEFIPHVGLSLGITKNMGNYETFKVSAWGTTDLLEGEEYDRAFERLSTHLEERVEKELEKWT